MPLAACEVAGNGGGVVKTLTYYRVGMAADALNVARQTVDSAVRSGRIRSVQTACGLPLVRLADVRRFLAAPAKRGRPRASHGRG